MIVDRRSIGGKRIILWSLAELCAGAQDGKKMEDVGRGNVSYEEEINYIIGVSFNPSTVGIFQIIYRAYVRVENS